MSVEISMRCYSALPLECSLIWNDRADIMRMVLAQVNGSKL